MEIQTSWRHQAALGTCACALACAASIASIAAATGNGLGAIDFNAALFEDFLGPYWETAQRLSEGSEHPAPGYLYPATLAALLGPLTALGGAEGPGGGAPSWSAVLFVVGSLALLVGGTLALRPARSLRGAALFGAACGCAHPVVHGAYWAQASLAAVGLTVAGYGAAGRGRSSLGGGLVGLAAALKLYPVIALAAFLFTRDRRALAAAAATAFVVGVVLPTIALGPAGFVAFHRESLQQLAEVAGSVGTIEGGRGSMDLAAIASRSLGIGAAWPARMAGLLLAFGCLVRVRARLREGDWAGATPLVLALPWLVTAPVWPHALAWIPVAWWTAWASEGRFARALTGLSFLAGCSFVLLVVQPPERHAWLALPALSAALAVAGVLVGSSEPRPSEPANE